MEIGKTYDVWYMDETTTRHKTLIFENNEYNILHFFNQDRQKRELIPVFKITRMEEVNNLKTVITECNTKIKQK